MSPTKKKRETGRTSVRLRAATLARLRAELDRLERLRRRGVLEIASTDLYGITVDAWVNYVLDQRAGHMRRSAQAARRRREGRRAACGPAGVPSDATACGEGEGQ